jgi:hypothetical protein
MPDTPPLSAEVAFFEEKRTEWLKHYAGQFALVKDRELLGTFSTQAEAIQAGFSRLGNVPFLVRQVLPSEAVLISPALVLGLIHARS